MRCYVAALREGGWGGVGRRAKRRRAAAAQSAARVSLKNVAHIAVLISNQDQRFRRGLRGEEKKKESILPCISKVVALLFQLILRIKVFYDGL